MDLQLTEKFQKQSFSVSLTEDTYEKEIAAARTFGFEKDKDKLIAKGLIKGANYQMQSS